MRRAMIWAVVGLVGWLLLIPLPRAYACSCALGTPAERVARADVVFVGNATQLGLDRWREPPPTRLVVVARVYKGVAYERTMVRTPSQSGGCRADLPLDQPVVIIGTRDRNGVQTNMCFGPEFGSARVEPMVRSLLGTSEAPRRGDDPAIMRSADEPLPDVLTTAENRPALVAVAAAFGAVVVGASVLIRRRGSRAAASGRTAAPR